MPILPLSIAIQQTNQDQKFHVYSNAEQGQPTKFYCSFRKTIINLYKLQVIILVYFEKIESITQNINIIIQYTF